MVKNHWYFALFFLSKHTLSLQFQCLIFSVNEKTDSVNFSFCVEFKYHVCPTLFRCPAINYASPINNLNPASSAPCLRRSCARVRNPTKMGCYWFHNDLYSLITESQNPSHHMMSHIQKSWVRNPMEALM